MKRAAIILALLLVLPGAVAKARAAGADFTVSPPEITIHAFYNGTTLKVEGKAQEGAQMVVKFTGAPEEVRMKQKGKALGLLWMNMNTLHFGGVPKVCLVESSAPLKDLGDAGSALGLTGLAEKITIEPASADRGLLLPELLKLKRKEGLYRETSGAVTLGAAGSGQQPFSAVLAIPSRLSPGSYVLEVFAVKDGKVLSRSSQTVDAKLVGVPAMMADLAFNHGAWYGILASIIAILAGLAIGLVFQSKEPH